MIHLRKFLSCNFVGDSNSGQSLTVTCVEVKAHVDQHIRDNRRISSDQTTSASKYDLRLTPQPKTFYRGDIREVACHWTKCIGELGDHVRIK
jgi:hypothetical protein